MTDKLALLQARIESVKLELDALIEERDEIQGKKQEVFYHLRKQDLFILEWEVNPGCDPDTPTIFHNTDGYDYLPYEMEVEKGITLHRIPYGDGMLAFSFDSFEIFALFCKGNKLKLSTRKLTQKLEYTKAELLELERQFEEYQLLKERILKAGL